MLSREMHIIKNSQYNYETTGTELALAPRKMPYTVVIKRQYIEYSFEQKYKLGILTAEEYAMWMHQLADEKRKEAEAQRKKAKAGSGHSHTFWEDDEGDRMNVSNDAFDKFLAENNLDVSNTTSVDVEALIKENNNNLLDSIGYESTQDSINTILDSASAEEEQAAILASISGAGSDDENRVLTTEEIQALFAAMGEG